MGVSNYDVSSTIATIVSQRLVRKLCRKCAKERDYNALEKQTIEKIGKKYDVDFDIKGKKTYDAVRLRRMQQ